MWPAILILASAWIFASDVEHNEYTRSAAIVAAWIITYGLLDFRKE